jgi:hypothetical protein
MKVTAAVVILCLILTVVNGAVFQVPAVIKEVKGQKVVTCSVTRGGVKYKLKEGKSKRLPSVNGGYCANCGPCTEAGMSCADQYKKSPGCPGLKFNTDENGNSWAVGK